MPYVNNKFGIQIKASKEKLHKIKGLYSSPLPLSLMTMLQKVKDAYGGHQHFHLMEISSTLDNDYNVMKKNSPFSPGILFKTLGK